MSREATIKYFLLSIFSSAMVLFGLAWIYGIAGTTNLSAIADRAHRAIPGFEHGMLLVAQIIMIAGISFRLTAVPFHFYAPDVFQGVAPSASAMLSFVPKVVGFAALLQILPLCAGADGIAAWAPTKNQAWLFSTMALITMTFGNVMAFRQTSVLRMLAWSSISHAGYMLVGLAVATQHGGEHPNEASGQAALMFYLPIYGLMSIGVFAVLAAAGNRSRMLRSLEDLHGLSQTRPALALAMAVCVFGLSGLPPTGGFLGKLNLFVAAWVVNSQLSRTLAIALAANAVVAAAYYLRLIGLMYFETPKTIVEPEPRPASAVAGAFCAVSALLLFASPQWLWNAAAAAVSLVTA
jgi:NADH-quinone oxidoreductase subunit N